MTVELSGAQFPLRASDRCELAGWRLSGPPKAPALLLLHSANQTHRTMLPLATSVADLVDVTVPDLRGFGASVCREQAAHNWDRLADDVLDWCRAIRAELGPDRPVVVGGFALGASVAVRAAARSGASAYRIDQLVLLAPHHVPGEPINPEIVAQVGALADRIERDGTGAVLGPWLDSLPEQLAGQLRRDIGLTDPASLVASSRGLMTVNPLQDSGLVTSAGAQVRRILVVPGDDPSHPATAGTALAELLRAGGADVDVSPALAGVSQPGVEQWTASVRDAVRVALTGESAS